MNNTFTFEATKPELAKLFGVSERTVERLVQSAILQPIAEPRKGARQKFDLCVNVKKYIDHLIEQTSKKDGKYSAMEEQRLAAEVSIKKAKATIATLEAEELKGKMHRAEDIENITEGLVYAIRGALMALPGRLAVDVANVTNPAEVATLIRNEVYKIMTELSQYEYDSSKYEERVRERRKWERADRKKDVSDGDINDD